MTSSVVSMPFMSPLHLSMLTLLSLSACDQLVMVSEAEVHPSLFASDAGAPLAAPMIETSAWASPLGLPREMRIAVTGPDRRTTACDASELTNERLVGCETLSGWYSGPGDYAVAVSSTAVDGLRDELTQPITLRGDEARVGLRVAFDEDGAPEVIHESAWRRPPLGLSLRQVADPREAGEPPRFALENHTDQTFFARWDQIIQGHVELLEAYEPPPPPLVVRTCGSVAGPWSIEPGGAFVVPRPYAMGGWPRLIDGLYAFRVQLRASWSDEQVDPIVVETQFEVLGSPGPEARQDELASFFASAFAADEVEGAAEPPRPGEARPSGLEGSLDAIGAPLVRSGATLAGTLGPRETRHYRLDALEGQRVVVRGFARCERDPCEAELTFLTGPDADDRQGRGVLLRRRAGRWSRRGVSLRAGADDPVLSFRCAECRGPVTYIVRVEAREPYEEW